MQQEPAMHLTGSDHYIMREELERLILSGKQGNNDESKGKKSVSSYQATFYDFEDTDYLILVNQETPGIITISMALDGCVGNIVVETAAEARKSYLDALYPPPVCIIQEDTTKEDKYSVEIQVNIDTLIMEKGIAEAKNLIENMVKIKENVMLAPLYSLAQSINDDGGVQNSRRYDSNPIKLRDGKNAMWIITPTETRLDVIYAIHFQDSTDQAIARAFLRQLAHASGVAFYPTNIKRQPPQLLPPEISALIHIPNDGIPPCCVGYVRFGFAANVHLAPPDRRGRCLRAALGFRPHLRAHVKAARAALAAATRRRAAGLLRVAQQAFSDSGIETL